MQRSSETIGTIAAALAKAQAELINPEKSQVATVRPSGSGAAERSFRYAPLSSGLDIVRKTLGQHEIATMQTTAIDDDTGLIRLTTMLAHSSGEWVSSDWPVCPISETVAPRRMGAALTYARRYALFTLVGIAGEDDIDAPDLNAPSAPQSGPEKAATNSRHRLNGSQSHSTHQTPGRRSENVAPRSAKPILDAKESAALRDQLFGELNVVASSDDAATWAHRILGAKNSLTTPDARLIEEAFQVKLTTLEDGAKVAEVTDLPLSPVASPIERRSARTAVSDSIDKSRLAHPEPRRARDKAHVKFVAKHACLICGRRPSDPHHLRFAQPRALGRKVSDEFTVPLCRGHHREVHRCGDEAAWWKKAGIDPTAIARRLWLETHPLPRASDQVSTEGIDSPGPVDADRSNTGRDQHVSKRGRNYKTKPIAAGGPQ